MAQIGINKIVVENNVRTVEGIEDLGKTKFKDLPPDEQEEIEMLAQSINRVGLLQPILVKDLKGRGYRLVAGWRRLMAYSFLKKTTIEAKVLKTKKEDESLVQLVENVHRKDLDPVAIATSLDKVRTEKGLKTQEALAKFVNKSVAWVSQHSTLLKAVPEVHQAVKDKEIGIGGAREIAQLPKAEQVPALEEAREEAKKAGDVDKKTGKAKIKVKGARRQSRRSKKARDEKQTPIRPVKEREQEQRKEVITAFFADVHGQKKIPDAHKNIVGEFWDFLMEKKRLIIK